MNGLGRFRWAKLNQESLDQLRCNDPIITTMDVQWGHGEFARSVDWAGQGVWIGGNTHLKKLATSCFQDFEAVDNLVRQNFEAFCQGLAHCSSIETFAMTFVDIDLSRHRDAFSSLSQILEHATNLSSIYIENCDLCVEGTRMLASALSRRCNKSSVMKIELGYPEHTSTDLGGGQEN